MAAVRHPLRPPLLPLLLLLRLLLTATAGTFVDPNTTSPAPVPGGSAGAFLSPKPIVEQAPNATAFPLGANASNASEGNGSTAAAPSLVLGEMARATGSPIATYADDLLEWLHDAPYQAAVSICALAVGLVCAWDGPAIWHVLFTLASACLGALIAHSEARAFQLTSSTVAETAMMLEVGATVGLATHFGFEGFQLLFGAAMGVLGAYGVGGWARGVEGTVPGLPLLWYSIGAALGLLVYTVWRRPVLAMLAPLLGGLLVSSGIAALLGRAFNLLTAMDDGHAAPGSDWLPPAGLAWVDVAGALVEYAGGASLAALCCVVLLGAMTNGLKQFRCLAVSLLSGGIAASIAASSTGAGCQMVDKFLHSGCPSWLTPTSDWRWLVCSGTLWGCVTAATAWRQIGLHGDARSYTGATGAGPFGGYLAVDQEGCTPAAAKPRRS